MASLSTVAFSSSSLRISFSGEFVSPSFSSTIILSSACVLVSPATSSSMSPWHSSTTFCSAGTFSSTISLSFDGSSGRCDPSSDLASSFVALTSTSTPLASFPGSRLGALSPSSITSWLSFECSFTTSTSLTFSFFFGVTSSLIGSCLSESNTSPISTDFELFCSLTLSSPSPANMLMSWKFSSKSF